MQNNNSNNNANNANNANNETYSVIDELFAAVLSANKSKETIDQLRPEAEQAVKLLLREQGKPSNFTGTIEYHGFKIVVRRPKSFTWEKNTQIKDPQLDYYKSLHAMCEQLETDLKKRKEEMRGQSKSLAIAYPDSDSIKYGFTIAFLSK
jgi:hypothetical protein